MLGNSAVRPTFCIAKGDIISDCQTMNYVKLGDLTHSVHTRISELWDNESRERLMKACT